MKLKIESFRPGCSIHPDGVTYAEGPLQCEISTRWLGMENPGMNVAIYSPEYGVPGWKMLMCVYPGGYFMISSEES